MKQNARKDDAVLIVCQNNEARNVSIELVNEQALTVLGYKETELLGKPLNVILGRAGKEALEDYLEYEEDALDLDEVLRRVRDFKIKTKDNAELHTELKIVRDPARDQHQWFRLIMRDEKSKREQSALMEMIHANLQGHQSLDPMTGMPDRDSAEKAVEVVSGYTSMKGLDACFAVVRIDRFLKSQAKYGEDACAGLLKHITSMCQRNFRASDVIFRLGNNRIGIVLFNISADSARIVLNRLRWAISSHRIEFGGKSDFSVTVSVSFLPIGDSGAEVFHRCDGALVDLDDEERNQLVELAA